MRKVFKYELPIEDYAELALPIGTQVLHVGEQHGKLCLWALVGNGSMTKRRFRIAGTGHPIDEMTLSFIGTVMLMGGGLVFHVFEVTA